MKKNNLDERQEQTLLRIEHNGCWLSFWGLMIALGMQKFIYGTEMKEIAGEFIVFMLLALYLVGACMKNGIWDRRLKANTATNLICSLIAGGVVAVFDFLLIYSKYSDKPIGSLASGVFAGGATFILCFAGLQIAAVLYRKKLQKCEEEPEE